MGLNLPSTCCGLSSNGQIGHRGVSRGHSSYGKRDGSSRRRDPRPVKVSGDLSQNEGPNLMGRCLPPRSLETGDRVIGEFALLYSQEPSGTAVYGPVCTVLWGLGRPTSPATRFDPILIYVESIWDPFDNRERQRH